MKKILFALVALLPLLVSCGKQDRGDNTFSEPRFVQVAGQLVPLNNNIMVPTSLTKGSDLTGILWSIELTESGLYAVSKIVQNRLVVRMGDYSVNNNVYTLNGFGTMEFDNSTPGTVDLHLTPSGSETMNVPAKFAKAAKSDPLYRGWTIDKTRVTVKGWTTASADFVGCDFNEIADFLRKNGHKVPDDIKPGLALRSVSFTGTEKMFFYYSDGSADASTFQYNGSNFTYTWDDDKMGFTFLTDKATIEYLDGKCILSINASIENSTTSGSVTFVMSPMD